MSRIGKQPILVPDGVTVTVDGGIVRVKGPKGELTQRVVHPTQVAVEDNIISVSVPFPDQKSHRERWGLMQRLVRNMVIGVTEGYLKKLELNGVGYKASLSGNMLQLHVGFSHAVDFELPEGVTGAVEKNVISLSGIDKQLVGEIAAQIRRVRKPEPYKGKGIKYVDEIVRRKAGKQAK